MTVTALVIDDSKLARIVLRKAICALQPDWTVLEAADAVEALAKIDQEAIDLAVLDYNMPGQNGLALAETLREQFPKMPLALATANVQDEIFSAARAIDVTFVAKPATPDTLRGFISGAALRLRSRPA